MGGVSGLGPGCIHPVFIATHKLCLAFQPSCVTLIFEQSTTSYHARYCSSSANISWVTPTAIFVINNPSEHLKVAQIANRPWKISSISCVKDRQRPSELVHCSPVCSSLPAYSQCANETKAPQQLHDSLNSFMSRHLWDKDRRRRRRRKFRLSKSEIRNVTVDPWERYQWGQLSLREESIFHVGQPLV